MDCKEAEELMGPYALGALEAGESSRLEGHVLSCSLCSQKVMDDGELVARLAYAVPALEVPSRVKKQLLASIDAETAESAPGAGPAGWRWRAGLARALAWVPTPTGAVALGALIVMGLVVGGVWFNERLDRVASESTALKARLDVVGGQEGQTIEAVASRIGHLAQESQVIQASLKTMATNEVEMLGMVKQQRRLAYMAAVPQMSVSLLWSPDRSGTSRGMLLGDTRDAGGAVLAVLDLPPLPSGMVYKVWLVRGGRGYEAGFFTVDSTGYGQTVIIPVAPWREFDAVEITVEAEGQGLTPSGNSVLRGDL